MAPNQPRVYRLYPLNQVAIELGKGLDFLHPVSRLIWNGKTTVWHKAHILRAAIVRAGLGFDELSSRAHRGCEDIEAT